MTERYLAAEVPVWRHPADEPPPLGTKLLIYTLGGVCIIGNWNPEEGAVLWCPLPKLSHDMKARIGVHLTLQNDKSIGVEDAGTQESTEP